MFTHRIISVLGIIGMIMFNKQKDAKTYSNIKIFSITILTLFVLLNIGCVSSHKTVKTKDGRRVIVIKDKNNDKSYENCMAGKGGVNSSPAQECMRASVGAMPRKVNDMLYDEIGDLRLMYDLARRGCQLQDTPNDNRICEYFFVVAMDNGFWERGVLSQEEKIELRTIGLRTCTEPTNPPALSYALYFFGSSCNKVGTALMTIEPINKDGAKTAFEASCRYGNFDSCQTLQSKFGVEIDLAEAKKRGEEIKQENSEYERNREEGKAEYERKRAEKNQKGLATLLGTIAVAGSGGNPLPDLLSGKTPAGTEAAGAGAGTTVSAGPIPKGSYSSWSQAERDQAGPALGKMCESECASYKNACKAGGQRPCYEAAACTTACFVNNLPGDYPQLEAFKKSARENYDNAKKLGSNVPVFLKGR